MKARLEYAGYKIKIYDDCVLLCRPTGQMLKHYKHLGNALRGGEIDIRKIRKHVENPKTSDHQKRYWTPVLERFDESGSFEWWSAWYFKQPYVLPKKEQPNE